MKPLLIAALASLTLFSTAQQPTPVSDSAPPEVSAKEPSPALPAMPVAEGAFRIVTYNILGGRNTDGKKELSRVTEVIRRLNPDAIALQEVDVKTKRIGGRDLPAELSKLTGMNAAFGEAMPFEGGSYGVAILTRFTVEQQFTHALLGKKESEPRAALEARLTIPGSNRKLTLISTHLDHLDDNSSRLMQTAKLSEAFNAKSLASPALLAGDLNTSADSEEMKKLTAFWQPSWPADKPGFTWSSEKPSVRIDHILLQPDAGWKVLKTFRGDEAFPGDAAWIELLHKASDHLPVVLEVSLEAK